MYLPETNIGKFFNFISEYRIKSCGINPLPPTGYLVEIFGKSTFSCTVQWCMQMCHKPFPHHMRGHLKMLIYPPKTNMGNFFNFISEYRIKSCGIYPLPPTGYLVEILENLLFHCTVQWCMQICHKPFPHHMRATW